VKDPLDQLVDGYKKGHVDDWWDRFQWGKNSVIFAYFLRVLLRLHLGRFTEQLTCCT